MARTNGNGIGMKFKVEKNVKMPDPHLSMGRKYEWPFESMDVGECFYFPIEGDGTVSDVIKARGIVMRNAQLWRVTGRKFSTRVMPDGKRLGVWRIQ